MFAYLHNKFSKQVFVFRAKKNKLKSQPTNDNNNQKKELYGNVIQTWPL